MTVMAIESALPETTLESLKLAGNPFRNFFARNPDDEVCARYHVPELFAKQREQLLGVVDLYRANPTLHSEMLPVLGNKGAGKTHLLHSIKHGTQNAWQMLITPGTFQKDSDFLEYLLFQLIDTMLGGGKQRGRRPLEAISEVLGRRLLLHTFDGMTREEQMSLFTTSGLGKWVARLGLGSSQAQERTQWLVEQLARLGDNAQLRRLCAEVNLDAGKACELVWTHLDRTETHNTAGLMRRHIYHGFVRAALLGDESELANFLTYGFAEIDYKVKPSRQDLVLALLRVLMEVFQSMKVPVVVAFDQLEDLLLVRRNDDGQRIAESFFAGMVQAMHQIDGICFLVFAERGLWNRFVPSLDGYIQDRLNNPVHVPGHGTIKALRLEAPPLELVRRVVEVRMQPVLQEMAERTERSCVYPFSEEQVQRIAKTEPTLRDMLQQFRQLFDHLVYGETQQAAYDTEPKVSSAPRGTGAGAASPETSSPSPRAPLPRWEEEDAAPVKSVIIVETPAHSPPLPRASAASLDLPGLWKQAMAEAWTKLAPEGSLTGATRELQAGLGAFLQACHEHGVKLGPWRLQHVVPELTFSEHPTYGVLSIAHWVCKDGQPWKVGVGLFLGRGAGKPRDLEIKLGSLDMTPTAVDYLILLRPEDDVALTGKSKTIWQESERKGKHARLEPLMLEQFTILYGFPRFLAALGESLPPGQTLPNLADVIQEECEKLLEQICLPIST